MHVVIPTLIIARMVMKKDFRGVQNSAPGIQGYSELLCQYNGYNALFNEQWILCLSHKSVCVLLHVLTLLGLP